MARSRVLLPEPDGPVTSTDSPGLAASEMSGAQLSAVRQVEIEPVDLDAGAAALDLDRLRRFALGGDLVDLAAEPGEPLARPPGTRRSPYSW